MKIPFFTNMHQDELYGIEIREKLDSIIRSGVFILGDEVKKFQENIKKYLNVKHAIGASNGSDALFLAVNVFDFPSGSEVITTPFTFFASSSCISHNSLKPVFCDADINTYNIDPDLIESKITKNTKAILSVDLFNQTCDYDKIKNIAVKHDLKLIEDSAEAFGMKWKGISAGVFGDTAVLSFFPTKTLGAFGDAGMILTNDDILAEKLRMLIVHGASEKYHYKYLGINSRLDAVQAGILNIKLKYIDKEINDRKKTAMHYFETLKDIKNIKLPQINNNAKPVWYVISIQCEKRDQLMKHLNDNGIQTTIYYPIPMHLQECYKYLGYKKGDFPSAEKLSAESLALPIYYGMPENQVDYIADNIKSFYKGI